MGFDSDPEPRHAVAQPERVAWQGVLVHERDRRLPLIPFRNLVVALCVALVATWAALGETASANDLAPTAPVAASHTDHNDDHRGSALHAHSGVTDLMNKVLGIGHAHDFDTPDGHHHHTGGDTVSVLPAHDRGDSLLVLGSAVRWVVAGPLFTGLHADRADHPPKR